MVVLAQLHRLVDTEEDRSAFHACYAAATLDPVCNIDRLRPLDPRGLGFLNMNENLHNFFVEVSQSAVTLRICQSFLEDETPSVMIHHDSAFWNAFVAKHCIQCVKQ
jgi:hypothetical protein